MQEVPVSSRPRGLKQLSPENFPEALSYLSRDAIGNLPLMGFLNKGLSIQTPGGSFYGLWEEKSLIGVGCLAHSALWAGGVAMAQALGTEARHLEKYRYKIVVGPEQEVEVFLRAAEDRRPGKTETHSLYLLRQGEMKGSETIPMLLELASSADLEAVYRAHQELYRELVGRPMPDLEAAPERLVQAIDRKEIWVARDGDTICFIASTVLMTEWAVLLEGIWTRSDLRGRGVGSQCLQSLCSHLLHTYPAVCLYVNEEHSHLQVFYQRLGFNTDRKFAIVRFFNP